MTPTGKRRIRQLSRNQLDRRFDEIRRAADDLRPPVKGWVAAIRTSLGMSQADLADRLGLSKQAIAQLEQRELDGSVTLRSLRRVAEALGARVEYVLIPDRPASAVLEERAHRIARQMVTSVQHSMRLEDQTTDSDVEQRVKEIMQDLLASPDRLWSLPDA